MHVIVGRKQLAPDVVQTEVEAPLVARKRKAGQFVMIRINEEGERIPLTIADSDPVRGTITLIVQAVGKSTRPAFSPGHAFLRGRLNQIGLAGHRSPGQPSEACGACGSEPPGQGRQQPARLE